MGGAFQLSPVLYSLYELYEYRGAFERSRELGELLLHVASRRHDPVLLLGAYDALASLRSILICSPRSSNIPSTG
jgi:hypothetical protein